MRPGHGFCESCPLRSYCDPNLFPENFDGKVGAYQSLPTRTLGRHFMHTLCRHFTCDDNGREAAVQQLNLISSRGYGQFSAILSFGRRIILNGRVFHSSDKPNDDRLVDLDGYIFSQIDTENPSSEFAYTGRRVDKGGKIYIESFPLNTIVRVSDEIQRVASEGVQRNADLRDILYRLINIYKFSRSYSIEVCEKMKCIFWDGSGKLAQTDVDRPTEKNPSQSCEACYFNSPHSRNGCNIIKNREL